MYSTPPPLWYQILVLRGVISLKTSQKVQGIFFVKVYSHILESLALEILNEMVKKGQLYAAVFVLIPGIGCEANSMCSCFYKPLCPSVRQSVLPYEVTKPYFVLHFIFEMKN